jgi:hypothetical protein
MVPVEEEDVPVVVEPPKGSNLHHLPIAFALLPAAAGLVVGGGEKWTDVMLLGLVGVYLNWLVKCISPHCISRVVLMVVPWEWYHASRTLRLLSDSQQSPVPFFTGTHETVATPEETSTSAIASEDEDETPTPSRHQNHSPAITDPQITDSESEIAAQKLRHTELFALVSCVAAPLIGGWLLHYIREFLSRPSEGVVSTFNIHLFVMAAEIRPAMKLMEMVTQRSLHLQRLVHKNTLEGNTAQLSAPVDLEPFNNKIGQLENTIEELRMSIARVQGGREEVVTGVREGIRGEVEALNRTTPSLRYLCRISILIIGAVRRYEKTFALHRAHTEDRINLLSSRMNDLSLVVSDTNQTSTGVLNLILSIPETGIQFVQSLLSLPKVLLRRVLRILLGVKAKPGERVAMTNNNKGKGKTVKSPSKKRGAGGRQE